MNIKSKIISYFLISVIMAGLIIISCFSISAENALITVHKLYNESHRFYFKVWRSGVAHTNSNISVQGEISVNDISATFNSYLTVGNSYYITVQDTNTSYYYRLSNDSNGNNLLNYGSSITVSNPTPVFNDIYITNTTLSSSYYNYFIIQSGFTLTFNSQGGSAINAESGVTDITLGDSTGYFPQYIPTRLGYTFLGWSLNPGGTYVREVELTEDTTIYANWSTEYKQLNWSEIGTTAGYMAFQSSWLLNIPNSPIIANFNYVYFNADNDDELIFCDNLYDGINTPEGDILIFYYDRSYNNKCQIEYWDVNADPIMDWEYNDLPFITNNVMGICDFEHLYNISGWKLSVFTQPEGTTTINYITQNIDLYTNVSLSSPAPDYAYNNRTITYYYTGTKSHWYNEFNVTYYRAAGAPGFTETIKATQIENTNKYMFSINTQEFNEISISLKVYQTYTCALTISQYPGYVINIYNGTEHLTGSSTFEYDSYKGIDLRFDLEYPYVNVDVFLMELVEPPLQPEVTYDYVINSTVLKADATDGEGMMRFYVTADPYADCELIINPRYITDYTIVERNPIVSINSEGEMSWIIDTENAWDDTMSAIDYAQITANIPQVFNGILDGVYGLTGLSMIVTLLLVIGFTSWIIRNY